MNVLCVCLMTGGIELLNPKPIDNLCQLPFLPEHKKEPCVGAQRKWAGNF